MTEFKLDQVQGSGASGLDAFFENEPGIITPHGQKVATAKPQRIKVGSLIHLDGFQRLSAETLIHKSTQDLWTIKREGGGDYYIERLFQDGAPIKG